MTELCLLMREVYLQQIPCVFVILSGQPPLALKSQLREKGMALLKYFSNQLLTVVKQTQMW